MTCLICLSILALTCALGAVKATIALTSTIVETPTTTQVPFGLSGATGITSTGLNKSTVYDANSNPTATKVAYGTLTMTAGAVTLNLAAITGLGGVNQDFTGLGIRSIHLRAKSDNANPITIAFGAANPYTGLGAAFSLTLNAAKEALLEPNTTLVAAGVRTLDITGTGAQALDFIIVAGS